MPEDWINLDVAPDQMTAEFWIQVLGDQDITAMIHPSDAVSWMGVSGIGCRVLVRQSDLPAAQDVLASLQKPEE